jgi:hypothetical protein
MVKAFTDPDQHGMTKREKNKIASEEKAAFPSHFLRHGI